MAYGIEIRNSNGEMVMNSEDQLIQLRREVTRTGSSIGGGNYEFTHTKLHPSNILFFKLFNGDSVALDPGQHNKFYSSRSTIDVREASFAGNLNGGSGYGMNVYNSDGELVWTFSSTTIAARKWFVVPRGQGNIPSPTFNSDERWLALSRAGWATAWNLSGSVGQEYARGVKRISSTQIGVEDFSIGANQLQDVVGSTEYMIFTAD